jgi:ATPase subunit of ABC transporter with duplicated ATPase domains
VRAEVQRLVRRAELKRAIAACSTSAISRKAGELTRSHVSDALTKAFLLEAEALKLPATVAYAHSRTGKATSYQRIVLSAAGWADTAGGPTRVLSEGERRSVALAAFLAEVEFRGDHSAVVFDDPVSSLDHERRRLVATRLAELAKARQVIVFTHDLVFLHMLKQAADEKGTAVTDREIGRNSREVGVCREQAPTQAQRIGSLVGELKNRQQACAAAERAGKDDECAIQLTASYDLLRKGWERAVEELLFNQAVMRFDQRIQTNRLKPVHDIRPEDIAEIDAGMTDCSKQLHALAPAINEPRPTPADLLSGVQRLDRFVREMRGRGRQ